MNLFYLHYQSRNARYQKTLYHPPRFPTPPSLKIKGKTLTMPPSPANP